MRFSCREAFVEGRNLAIAFQWAHGRYDSLPALAAELVDLPVTLIFAAGGPPTAFAVKAATSKIPIVFSAVSDPVEIGLVPSLNQPGRQQPVIAIVCGRFARASRTPATRRARLRPADEMPMEGGQRSK
jgi:hypothetical protein